MKRLVTRHIFKAVLCGILIMSVMLAAGFTIGNVKKKAPAVKHPKVEIVMKDGGVMIFELYPENAPATVANFLKLTKSKFYNGLKFHRIIKNFMIQGGDPNGDGTGGAKDTIKGEFSANNFTKNTLKHTKGVISMARANDMNSASSQFFIVTVDDPNVRASLDGQYAAFGKMISGQKVLDALADTKVELDQNSGENSKPVKDVIIKRVFVLSE